MHFGFLYSGIHNRELTKPRFQYVMIDFLIGTYHGHQVHVFEVVPPQIWNSLEYEP